MRHGRNKSQLSVFCCHRSQKQNFGLLSSRLDSTGSLPPINVQADKGTTVHNARQFTTVATVVPGSEALISIVYLGQPIVKSNNGEGVSKIICEELSRYLIDASQL